MYLYVLNYNTEESEICALEIRRIYHLNPKEKYFFSDHEEDVTRSLFTKKRLEIVLQGTLDEILEEIEKRKITFDGYKVEYVDVEGYETHYKERNDITYRVGYAILGEFDMKSPKYILGITKIGEIYYFGILTKNTQDWHKHDDKPHHFSTALPVRQARTIVNIAVGDKPEKKLVDPCCGVGTVLLEACGLGYHIDGFDIHYPVKEGARKNLAYYGYTATVLRKDIHDVEGHYDTAIIDIPYGLFTHVEEETQQMIINNARRIADELVLVSNRRMIDEIERAGFQLVDECSVTKATFTRYIMVCR